MRAEVALTGRTFAASTIDLDDLSARVLHLAGVCGERGISLEGVTQLMPPHVYYRANAIAAHEASSTLFWGIGRLVALLIPAVTPALLGGVTALMAAAVLTGKRPEELMNSLLDRAIDALPGNEDMTPETAKTAMTRAISSPVFVTGLTYVVSGIDDLAAGMLGLPLPLSAAFGERGVGLLGPSAVAGAIVLGAGVLGAPRWGVQEAGRKLWPKRR